MYGLGDRIGFFNGNAEELGSFLPAAEYDLVYSFGVIHHSPQPERLLEQPEYIEWERDALAAAPAA